MKKSTITGIFLTILLFAAYILIFSQLFQLFDFGAIAFSFLPIFIATILLGVRGGLMATALVISISYYVLLRYSGYDLLTLMQQGGAAGIILEICMVVLIGYFVDIRKKLTIESKHRQEIEEELIAKEARYRQIVQEQNDLVVRFSRTLELTFTNLACSVYFGCEEDDLIGKKIDQLFPEADQEKVQKFVKHLVENPKSVTIEQPIINKNQQTHIYQWAIRPIENQNGKINEFQAVGHDITDQKDAEEKERSLRNLAEAMQDTTAALVSTLDFDLLLDRILENVGRVMPHHAANIMLIQGTTARIVRQNGYDKYGSSEQILQASFDLTKTPNLNDVVTTRKALAVPDVLLYEGWVSLPSNRSIRSLVSAPILNNEQVIGILNLDSEIPNFYSNDNIDILQVFADQVALAIRNAQLYQETQSKAQQFSLINQITQLALNASTTSELRDEIEEPLKRLFNADQVKLFVTDSENGNLGSVPEGQKSDFQKNQAGTEQHRRLLPDFLIFDQTLIIDDIKTDTILSAKMTEVCNFKALLGYNLKAQNQKLGVLLICFAEPQQFSQPIVEQGEKFAQQISLAISKTQSLEKEQQKSQQLTRINSTLHSLLEVSTNTSAALAPEKIYQVLGKELENLGIHYLLALNNPKNNDFEVEYFSLKNRFQSQTDENGNHYQSKFIVSPERIAEYQNFAPESQPIYLDDIYPVFKFLLTDNSANNVENILHLLSVHPSTPGIVLPFRNEPNRVGVMVLWGESLSQDDLVPTSLFAQNIANSLEKAHLYDEIRNLAITDQLSNTYNRRGLNEIGQHLLNRSKRMNEALAIMMIDIDYFKKINDEFGHLAGDTILVQLADAIKKSVRQMDIISRFGGEEFIILLPLTSPETAVRIGERLRENVETTKFSWQNHEISLTISVGIASYHANIEDLNSLIELADKALYLAKQNGRNQISTIQFEG